MSQERHSLNGRPISPLDRSPSVRRLPPSYHRGCRRPRARCGRCGRTRAARLRGLRRSALQRVHRKARPTTRRWRSTTRPPRRLIWRLPAYSRSKAMYSNGGTRPVSRSRSTGHAFAADDVFVVRRRSCGDTLENASRPADHRHIPARASDIERTTRRHRQGLASDRRRRSRQRRRPSDPRRSGARGLSLRRCDNTLRRAADICVGDADGANAFDPSVGWIRTSPATPPTVSARTTPTVRYTRRPIADPDPPARPSPTATSTP